MVVPIVGVWFQLLFGSALGFLTLRNSMRSSQLRMAAVRELAIVGEEAAVALDSFISVGPLFDRCLGGGGGGAAAAAPAAIDPALWQERGEFLARELLQIESFAPGGHKRLTRAEATRLYQYYLPLYFWVEGIVGARQSEATAAASATAPLFVGISCPQGGGKTTLVESLSALFERDGRTCAMVSIDDFYLTHADQQRTAAENPGNALLELRGNPGSHDTALALDTLRDLAFGNATSTLGGGGGGIPVPRYDKSAFSGKGDRADPSTWPVLKPPVDVVLMEGWCFGFKALPKGTFGQPGGGESNGHKVDERLAVSNQLLAGPYRRIHEMMDAWMVVEVESPRQSFEWREEAEAAMRAEGKPAMTKEEVADFVSRYMPAYEHYLPGLYADGPDGSEGKPVLSFRIDKKRNPVK